jgi:hypothetical protein
MKTTASLLFILLVTTSCDIILVEPAYDERNRIIGSYHLEEYSQTYNDYTSFFIYIRKSGIGQQVLIENFYNSDMDVLADYQFDKIYIDRQFVNGYEIEGVGTVYGNEIKFNYKVRDTYTNRPTDFCNATAR